MRWLVIAALAVGIWWLFFRRGPAQTENAAAFRRTTDITGPSLPTFGTADRRGQIFRLGMTGESCGCES